MQGRDHVKKKVSITMDEWMRKAAEEAGINISQAAAEGILMYIGDINTLVTICEAQIEYHSRNVAIWRKKYAHLLELREDVENRQERFEKWWERGGKEHIEKITGGQCTEIHLYRGHKSLQRIAKTLRIPIDILIVFIKGKTGYKPRKRE